MVPEKPFLLKHLLFLLFSWWGIIFFSPACTTRSRPSPPFHFDRQRFESLFINLPPEITGIKGYGELSIKGSQPQELNINLILKKPGKARIEVLNFLYQPSLVIVSDGKEVSVSQDGSRTVKTVPADFFSFRKLTGVKLSLENFISVMLGCPPDWPSLKKHPFKMETRADRVIYRLDFPKNKTIKLTVSGKEKLLQGYDVFNTGRQVPDMSISWSDYRSTDSGTRFPHDIRIGWPSKSTINLIYKSVETDPQVEDPVFSL